jgi:hypothetical protein
MTEEMPKEIYVDKDYPETGDNRFSLKNKEHRLCYELKNSDQVPAQDDVRDALSVCSVIAGRRRDEVQPHHKQATYCRVYLHHLEALIRAATQQPEVRSWRKPKVHICKDSPSRYCEYDTEKNDPMRDSCLHCSDPFERK